jgi:hypothetical protein
MIHALRIAGIKVYVFTRDRRETAIMRSTTACNVAVLVALVHDFFLAAQLIIYHDLNSIVWEYGQAKGGREGAMQKGRQ